MQKRDAGGAVRVVLDRCHLGGHAVFVALEVDDAVTTLVAAALMTDGDAALVVATILLVKGRKQRLLRLRRGDLSEIGDRLETAARARRLVLFDSHDTLFLAGFLLARLSAHQKPSYLTWLPDCRGHRWRLDVMTPV